MVEKQLEIYFDKLWPICRSITGKGLRESLQIIQELIPLQLTEIPTGSKVYDWEIPKEWNITDAYIICPDGNKIIDFKINNLHVVNYSIPVNKYVSFDELKNHLHYIEEIPDAIPYITSYYKETWGFCLSYNQFKKLKKEGKYKIVIDSDLSKGSLTYGEYVLKGDTDEEVLFSTYLCHPSMANNELSGPLVVAFLYNLLTQLPSRKYTYRFLFAPETIGVIAFLSQNGLHLKQKLIAGYVVTCCGDNADFIYKESKQVNSLADIAAKHVLKHQDNPYKIIPFSVGGSDERQYCSPGFNLPVGSLTRSMYQNYKEYHTSLDNKSFISFSAMKKTIDMYFSFVKTIEANQTYENTILFCEPHLGKRGLYPSSVNPTESRELIHNRMHLLSYADGKHSLIEIADLKNIPVSDLLCHITPLIKAGVLKINN